jgi:transcriptional regulator with XRE-family HTH domain
VNREQLLGEVAEALISIRTRLGYELEFAAQLAHLDPERLASAEEGALALDEPELQNLADAYAVDVTAFFGGRITPMSYLFGA